MYRWVRSVQKCVKPQYRCESRKLTDSVAKRAQKHEYGLVEVGEVSGFIERCLVAAGAVQSHAASLASVLVHADVRGHYSHGLNRLGEAAGLSLCRRSVLLFLFVSIEMYCREVASGRCDGAATPRVVKETTATALVDGRNGIGSVSVRVY